MSLAHVDLTKPDRTKVIPLGISVTIPVTGAAVVGMDLVGDFVFNPAGTIATMSFKMPLKPLDGQVVRIATSQTITALTLIANTSQTISGAPAAFPLFPNQAIHLLFYANTGVWYQINSDFARYMMAGAVVTKTGTAYTATLADSTIRGDATAASQTITLPTVASCFVGGVGKIYTIKKIDATANTVTIQMNGAETADGTNTKVLSSQYSSLSLQSNGTTWDLI